MTRIGNLTLVAFRALPAAAAALAVSTGLTATAPATAVAAVTAKAEIEYSWCCHGYGTTARDVVTVAGGPAPDKVLIVSVEGGYEIHDPAGVTPIGNCAAVSESIARCGRDVENQQQTALHEPPVLTIAGDLGDDELSAAGVAPDTSVSLFGNSGADRLTGGAGSDVVAGGPGPDVGLGGAGDDTFVDADDEPDSHDGGDGFDDIHHDRATAFTASLTTRRAAEDLLMSVEGLRGGSRDDTLAGSPGDDSLDGDAGDDRLSGRAGDDVLVDDPGDDVLQGGPGDDEVHHVSGRDRTDCGEGRRDRLVISTSEPIQVKRCERSDIHGGLTDDKYDFPRLAGTVRLDRIRRSGGALKVPAVCASRADCHVRVSLWRDERRLATRTARSGTIRLPLERRTRRIVDGPRLLTMTVRFVDADINYGGTANYVLDPA